MLQRCSIIWMKNLLAATYPFLHQGAQLLVVVKVHLGHLVGFGA
jgi:hypothetical protein